jgi:signal transduction histidine kinase
MPFMPLRKRRKENIPGYEPTVTVTTKRIETNIAADIGQREGGVLVTVADNGNGIPDDVVKKIFQPFFTTKPPGEGTGLGLSLSYDIVRAHGGEIRVETTPGEGSKFTIALPRDQS